MNDSATTVTEAISRINPAQKSMDDIVALCKRRGFVYPASEIYGGINGFWDYGPLGVALKNNVRNQWWQHMVECPPLGPDGKPLQIVGLDSSIIQHSRTWEASGHVAGFHDPMQTCRQCKKLFRADHVDQMLKESGWVTALAEALGIGGWDEPVSFDPQVTQQWAERKGRKLAPGLALVRTPKATATALAEHLQLHPDVPCNLATLLCHLSAADHGEDHLPCPNCGGDLTEPRLFNLMFESHAGAVKDEANRVYLRPETAQGIFLNYKNVLDTMRVKLPFGIAQIGKAFRNEVTPRNFIFRSREFEQMEMEWFCAPDESTQWFDFWKQQRTNWWVSLGVDPSHLILRDHDIDELSHYSDATTDVEYLYPFTAPKFGELEGIAHRGCFDLTQHQQYSGTKLDYFDQDRVADASGKATGEAAATGGQSRFVPHVIEPASGLTRGVLVLICEAYTPTPERKGSKCLMRFAPHMAPVKAGVFPLVNKDGMPEVAQRLYMELRGKYAVEFDVKQSIGKRYARMDEVGTPFCLTVDGQTLKDQTVTVRDRDTMAQQRIGIDRVASFLADKIE